MNSKNLIKAIHWVTYGILVTVPLVFWPQVMFPYSLPKIATFQIGVELLVGLWLALVILDRRYLPKISVFFWALAAYIGSLTLSLVFGIDPFRSAWSTTDRLIGVVGLLHFVMFALILYSLRKEFNWKNVWLVSFVVSVVVAISVWMQQFGMRFILYNPGDRPGGVFGNAAFVSGYLLFFAFIGSWIFVFIEKLWGKLLAAIGVAVVVAALFFSQTIAVMLGFAAGLVVLMIFGLVRGSRWIQLASGAILILLVAGAGSFLLTRHASFWDKIPGIHRVAAFSFQQSDVQDRLYAWGRALMAFRDKPVLGWGWDNFNIPFNQHYDPKLLSIVGNFAGTVSDKPHNVFLEYLEAGGSVGFLAYLFLLGVVVYGIFRKFGSMTWKPFFAAAFIAYCVQNAFVFDTVGTYLIFFLIFVFVSSETVESSGDSTETVGAPGSIKMRLAVIPILLALVPVYLLNIQMVRMFYNYYWGINYFLHQLPEASMISWQQSLAISTPYADYAKKDFASVVQQGLQQGIALPDLQTIIPQAISGLREAEVNHPRDYLFPMVLADFYNTLVDNKILGKENAALAVKEAEHALELSPDRQQIFYILAKARIVAGDITGAKALFEHAIALNPDAGDPHFFYGFLAYGTGDYKTGRDEIAKAAALGRGPQDYKEATTLGDYAGDYDHDYKKAVAYYKLAMDMMKNITLDSVKEQARAGIYLKLGIAYYFDGDNKEARDAFGELVKMIDVTKLNIYPQLEPVLKELKVIK